MRKFIKTTMLEYLRESSQINVMGKNFTWDNLSVCGYKNTELTLKDREWVCPSCGIEHNRDFNAAMNIEKEGLRILNNKEIGSRTAELMLVESKSLDPH